jgi:hypothetical protein
MAYNRTLQHFVSQQELATIWSSGLSYGKNQFFIYEYKIYKAQISHTSDVSFLSDLATGKWIMISGASEGSKNYIKNPDFDGGATTNWLMKKVTLSSKIPTGNFGTADAGHTITTSAINPLEGTSSLLVDGASLFTAGNCLVSDAFTIDREDQAKVMGWSFAYEAVTSNMDFSGTSSNTWAVYIAEVSALSGGGEDTVTTWIQPAGVYNLTQGTGVGLASGTFQTSATGLYYRLVLVCITSEAAATTLKVDDFQLGPQKVVYGSPVTDWVSYTPTVSGFSAGTASTSRYSYRRVGDSIEIIGNVMAGGTGVSASGDFQFSLPSGLTFDSSKMYQNGHVIGVSEAHNSGNYRYGGSVISSGASTFKFSIKASDANGGNLVGANQPSTGWWNSSGDQFSFSLSAPITGWSSSVQMSNDTDTRVVAARILANNSTTFSLTSSLTTITNLNTKDGDTHNAYNISTSIYTVPVSGWYFAEVNLNLLFSGASGSGSDTEIGRASLEMGNSATVKIVSGTLQNNVYETISVSNFKFLSAGETIYVRGRYTSGAAASGAVGQFADANNIKIYRLSGPATIAASESVVEIRENRAGTTINNTETTIPYSTLVRSSHNAWNSNRFYAPISGTYSVSMVYQHLQAFIDRPAEVAIYKNGSADVIRTSNRMATWDNSIGSYGDRAGLVLTNLFYLNAGDYLEFKSLSPSGSVNLNTLVGTNRVAIYRVGN